MIFQKVNIIPALVIFTLIEWVYTRYNFYKKTLIAVVFIRNLKLQTENSLKDNLKVKNLNWFILIVNVVFKQITASSQSGYLK